MGTPGARPAAPARPGADTPLVSVMVPVHDVERYLPQCVDSILAQDYGNLDILLVDTMLVTGSDMVCCRHVDEWAEGAVPLKKTSKLERSSAHSDISCPEGRAFEDIFTTHRVFGRIGRATCPRDAVFHYCIRSGGISRTRSVSDLVDYWLAHSGRQTDPPGVPDELQAILLRNRIFATFRT